MSSGTLYRVALVRTDVSEEHAASNFRVTRLLNLRSSQRGYASRWTAKRASCTAVIILITLKMEAVYSFETSVVTRATRYKVSEGICH
jgi:hypothetical protein